jgi:hypothetical protein
MQPGQKGGPEERGARLLSGWFFYEDTPKSGRVGQAYGLPSERGPKERDGRLLAPLMENGKVDRAGRGPPRVRPRVRPRRICADKGYAKGVVRRYLRRRGIRITIDALEGATSIAAESLIELYTAQGISWRGSLIASSTSGGWRPGTRSERRTMRRCSS